MVDNDSVQEQKNEQLTVSLRSVVRLISGQCKKTIYSKYGSVHLSFDEILDV